MAQAHGEYDVVVIGSGIGGLSAAALLATLHGKKVLVLERHFRAGGYTHTFTRRNGFRWDVGVHYVGEVEQPGQPRDVMRVITGGQVRWQRLPETYDRLSFPDFEFAIRAGRENFRSDLLAAFPAERKAIDRYFRDVDRAAALTTVLGIRATAPAPIAHLVDALSAPRQRLALATTGDWLSANVRDERLRAVLGARWMDYGLPPAQSAFLQHAVIARTFLEGGHYPVGSSAVLAEAATRVIEADGGAVRVRAEVGRIVVEGGRAVGVRLVDGELIRAPLVVSDAGARNTFLKLLPAEVPLPFRESLRAVPRGMSHVTLYLGLSRSPESLGVRAENVWLHDSFDQDGMWARRNALVEGAVPQAMLSFPSLKDAQARAHTAEIVATVDDAAFEPWAGTRWMKRGADYEALKERMTEALIACAEKRFPGLRDLIVFRELSTPLSTEHFCAHPGGEIYGIPGTPERFRCGFLRPRTPVPGLLLTGADAMMLGVVGAAMGGLMCVVAAAGPKSFGLLRRAARDLDRATGNERVEAQPAA